ncbi:MAG TPA: metallophosphoesterase [Thermoleophilaceae bacterium]|nr:metallophosphoesterase [Thermoleophilaceae bacterium]
MFKVQGLAGPVTGATLRVWGLSALSSGFEARSVASTTWSESTITYSNAPAAANTVTGTSGAVKNAAWASVPVNSLVTGNGTYSFALTGTSSTALSVAAKENSASTAAQLVVNTSTPAQKPSNAQAPLVTGTVRDGQTLTADPGAWSGSAPIGYAYQWQRCDSSGNGCGNIANATAKTLTSSPADVGNTLRVLVTAGNSAGTALQGSAPTATIQALAPANTAAPAITGTPQQGLVLSVGQGSWSGSTPLGFAYQWQRCDSTGAACAPIDLATGTAYTPVSADVGHALRVALTASNSGGSATTASAATAPVAPPPDPPASTQAPSITGLPVDSQTLTTDGGSWSGTPPLTPSYRWQRCDALTGVCTDIPGAGAQSYKLVSDDVGAYIQVVVTATNVAGSALATSPQTAAIAAVAPVNDTMPSVAGSTIDGQTLTAAPGAWHGTAPITYGYQWRRCDSGGACGDIGGASQWTYTLTSDDVGQKLVVRVTGSNRASVVSADSPATSVIAAAEPANTAVPTISGTAQDGGTLTATSGSWTGTPTITYGYQWRRCDTSGAACADITGATQAAYTAAPADVGRTLVMQVTSTGPGGSSTASSAASATVAALPPANTVAPAIAGVAVDGQTLTTDTGSWTGTPTIAYASQWQRCDAITGVCNDIATATGPNYTLVSADVGYKVRVRVTGSNAGGSLAALSLQTAAVGAVAPTNTALPVVSGAAQPGQTLTTSNGSWSGTTPTYRYQWQRCDNKGANCANITNQTASTYVVASGDQGSTLSAAVTATNSAGNATANSATTAVVTLSAPVNTALPTIAGTARDGQTLSAANGTWTGASSFATQWRRCDAAAANCADITGATANTYSLVAADVGSTVRAVVTATNTGGSTSATSAQTAVVAAVAPANTAPPAVSGTARDGQVLTATSGNWTGTAPTLGYQWRRCDTAGANCADIATATATTYTLTPNDVGSTVRAQVTASNPAGSAVAASAATPVVAALPPANSVPPTISGSTQQGQTLTVVKGTWTGTAPSFAYQWRRCDTSGGTCADVSGATSTTYALDTPDVGKTLRVVVTGSNSAGSTPATSSATAVVSASGVDPVIATAGDIACDPAQPNFNSGLGKNGNCAQKATSDLMVNKGYAAVLPLGDNQYYCGAYDAFMGSYDLSWGLLKPITHPVPGNHEYLTHGGTEPYTACDTTNAGAAGYFRYFGSAAGAQGGGYYAYDVGSWRLIALNSNCTDAGGCGTGSPQGKFLAAELAAHPTGCTLAYWHIPLYSSGGRASPNSKALWTQLYNGNADLVLSAHDHLYERFAPQDDSGNLNTARGLREFVVGTGGANHTSLASLQPNSEIINDQTYGILELTLHPNSYDWKFRPIAGQTFTDAGTTACH